MKTDLQMITAGPFLASVNPRGVTWPHSEEVIAQMYPMRSGKR